MSTSSTTLTRTPLVSLPWRAAGAIAAALGRSGDPVSGPGGVAELLGLNPRTLFSRMSVLGLRPNTARRLPCPCGGA